MGPEVLASEVHKEYLVSISRAHLLKSFAFIDHLHHVPRDVYANRSPNTALNQIPTLWDVSHPGFIRMDARRTCPQPKTTDASLTRMQESD